MIETIERTGDAEAVGESTEASLWITLYTRATGDDLASWYRSFAADVVENSTLIGRLVEARWEVSREPADDGFIDVVARKNFAAVEDALSEAARLGAEGRILDWGDEDYEVGS